MTPTRLLAAALLALAATVHAAPGPDVNLDGSTKAQKKSTLATAAARQLQQNNVPSAKTDPAVDVKAQADAEMAARDARDKGPRLQVQRQNLKNADAAAAMRRNATPNSIDHATAYGDIEHTEQVTNLKMTLKK